MHHKSLTMRLAHSGDAAAIARLVEMEEAQPLRGESLVAELDGTIIAALSLHDGQAVADLFRPTAGIVRVLQHLRVESRDSSRTGSMQRSQPRRRLATLRRAGARA